MPDEELLELAAKAVGYEFTLEPDYQIPCIRVGTVKWSEWNPLTNDGDALRLAVKLGLKIVFWHDKTCAIYRDQASAAPLCLERISNDPYAATRRAIVRAAAEIGKGMK